MELTQLSLHNFKNHRKLTLDLKPGVTGIVGDNGSGKSSIISAISFLFTGEVDTKEKKKCITLGETEGWVRGSFKLNGKEGSLERHLTSSKVILTYDGETYNKVSEVAALWAELLKIDNAIFNNVIIAKQGEIQKLFSDETSVREKIFQKIFLVPPTEKLRNLIWDDYVKNCPPEKPAEDLDTLRQSMAAVLANRMRMTADIEQQTSQLADATLIKCVTERVQYLEKCQQDDLKRPSIAAALASARAKRDEKAKLIEGCKATLPWFDLKLIRQRHDMYLVNKTSFNRRASMLVELNNLEGQLVSDEVRASYVHDADMLRIESEDLLRSNIENNARLREIATKIHKLSQLGAHANCPTCGQVLPDTSAVLAELDAEETALQIAIDKDNKRAAVVGRTRETINTKIATADHIATRVAHLRNEIAAIGNVNFSEAELVATKKEITEVEALQADLRNAEKELCTIDAEITVLEGRMANLSTYEGDSTIEADLELMRSALTEDARLRERINQMEISSAKLQHEFELYGQRLRSSEQNVEYNARRKMFIDRLTQTYDVLHVSRFPRKLIETYMDQVQTSLATYLEHFDLPYSVKINDGFKIVLTDSVGRELPTVSGGQEMMVGICLRLALHKMFAKSFPIWIIDEGTTHLSETKKPQYFALINELRNQKIINQIIIIDHDERLGNVVDQTIQL